MCRKWKHELKSCSNCRYYKEMFEQDDYSGETFDVSWCTHHEVPIDAVSERRCEEWIKK